MTSKGKLSTPKSVWNWTLLNSLTVMTVKFWKQNFSAPLVMLHHMYVSTGR